MTDIVERLRFKAGTHVPVIDTMAEAAALIERLTKQCDEAHNYRVAMENLDAQTIVGLRAEIERLQAAMHQSSAMHVETQDLMQAEIERLRALLKEYEDHAEPYWRADNERLRAALQPFAAAADTLTSFPDATSLDLAPITLGDLRQARAALAGKDAA